MPKRSAVAVSPHCRHAWEILVFPPGFNHTGIITLRSERSFLGAGELPHGVVEGQAEHLNMEVNGIAGEVAFGPAPIAVFDDESGKDG